MEEQGMQICNILDFYGEMQYLDIHVYYNVFKLNKRSGKGVIRKPQKRAKMIYFLTICIKYIRKNKTI